MTRVRIEGLLAAFPKLVAGVASTGGGRQHTYVETDTVRYLYQPLEVREKTKKKRMRRRGYVESEREKEKER
jgi:hypothetical protein